MDSLERLRKDLEWSLPRPSNDTEATELVTEGLGQSPAKVDVQQRQVASNDPPAGWKEVETRLSDNESREYELGSELSLGTKPVTESDGNALLQFKMSLESQGGAMSVDSVDSEASTIKVRSVSGTPHQDYEVSSIVTISGCQPRLSNEAGCDIILTTEAASETNMTNRGQVITWHSCHAQGCREDGNRYGESD